MNRLSRSIASGAMLMIAALLAGCSSKNGVVDPAPPPLPEGVGITESVVSWTTDIESRGAVRYGFSEDNLDRIAYPRARDRGDRELVRSHEVPLLGVRAGQTVYIQVLSEVPGGESGVSAVGAFVASASSPSTLLTSTMIHMGFGDCHLITMPSGTHVLVDAGERHAQTAVRRYLEAQGVTTIRAMLATHVHIDHLGGFVGDSRNPTDGLLNLLPPAVFLDSPTKSFSRFAYDDETLPQISSAGIRRVVISRGQSSLDTPDLAWDPNVEVLVLSSGTPSDYTPTGGDLENTDINNDSIVLKFSYGDVDFIIGGDAERDAERSILRAFSAEQLDVEYYKAHHHGLPDASSGTWVNTLRPRIVFIPNTQAVWDGDIDGALASTMANAHAVGAHVFAIDDAASLDRLRDSGIQYNVTFVTDGVSYEVRLENANQRTVRKTDLPSCVREYVSREPSRVETH